MTTDNILIQAAEQALEALKEYIYYRDNSGSRTSHGRDFCGSAEGG